MYVCVYVCVYMFVCIYARARKYMYDRCGYKRMKKKKKQRKMRVCLKCKYVFAGDRD